MANSKNTCFCRKPESSDLVLSRTGSSAFSVDLLSLSWTICPSVLFLHLELEMDGVTF